MQPTIKPELIHRFESAVSRLDARYSKDAALLTDESAGSEVRTWIDGKDTPLAWHAPFPQVTCDEWFFITTLYGEMTLEGQRSHIRKFFPTLFVNDAGRDIRSFTHDLPGYKGLRSNWMKSRLCKMSQILRDNDQTMADYVRMLQDLEKNATPDTPMPAFERVVADHRATGWKALSCFVRDCVGGNCFPIDSRVEKELVAHDLPVDERLLVGLCLAIGRSPRPVARMFYYAGGQ